MRETQGVLLVNLGSPSAPTPPAVRRFLSEFLGDPLVVDVNPVVWWLVRNLIILPFRSRASAALYRKVWTDEGSPLIAITRRLRDRVARALGDDFTVDLAMRYGEPSIGNALARMQRAGCREVLVLTMFPQASQTTTGTVEREVHRCVQRLGAPLRVRIADPYFAHQSYIEPLVRMLRAHLDDEPAEHVVLSFHGLPVRYVENGDPYRDHCEASAAAIAAEAELAPGTWTLSYQSRFGREPWLGPATDEVVLDLARRGRKVLVACPGFTADCLETLEEIDQTLRERTEEAGGQLRVVPCLNDSDAWVEGVTRLAREGLGAIDTSTADPASSP